MNIRYQNKTLPANSSLFKAISYARFYGNDVKMPGTYNSQKKLTCNLHSLCNRGYWKNQKPCM